MLIDAQVLFCFIGMRKHHCQHFYIHQHQVELSLIPFPVFTATKHCQGTVNLGFFPIICCVSRKFSLCKYFFLLQNKIRFTETIFPTCTCLLLTCPYKRESTTLAMLAKQLLLVLFRPTYFEPRSFNNESVNV